MHVPADDNSIAVEPCALDAMLSAISDAVDALVSWNITAFQSAVDRQSTICDRLALETEGRQLSASSGTARKIQELTRVYDQLLQHSVQWTRTIHSILEASGHRFPGRASVHFRG